MSTGLAKALHTMAEQLDTAGIPFMLAGSFASTYHGHPRTTQDIDMVIDPTRDALQRFVDSLPADRSYVDRTTAIEAFDQRDMFNVIDLETGWKVDLILRKARPFSRSEFERREAVEWMGVRLFVVTAEDVILSKLEWARLSGGSERQMRDVAGVLQVHGDRLDLAYLERWLDVLAVRDLWDQVTASTQRSGPAR
jgi:hypothetical protein